jgi:hypothetical protein
VGNNNEEEEERATAAQRKSSRSTAFRGEMKDPRHSIAELLRTTTVASGDIGIKRRGSRQQSSLESQEGNDEENEVVAFDSPTARRKKKAVVKSPDKQHSKRRMTKVSRVDISCVEAENRC